MRRWITVVMMVVLFSFTLIAHSQNVPRFQFALDYRFSLGLTQRALGQVVKYSDNSMHGNSINLTGLWNINNVFSSGVGIGFTSYSYAPNVLPVFATVRYRPFSKTKYKSVYAFSNVGYSFGSDNDRVLSSGFLCEVGIGWQKMFYRHFGINFQMGYELKQFRVPGHDEWDADMEVFPEFKFNMWRNSIFFGFGLLF